jgi:hypothetical protein
MSLFSFVKDLVLDPVKTASSIVSAGTSPTSKLQPFIKAAPTIDKAIKAVGAGIIAAPFVAPVVASPAGQAVIKSLIPKSIAGKAAAIVAAPVIYGAVRNQPAAVAKAAIKAPSSLANFGGNVANLAANPSAEQAKKVFQDNPIVTSLVGVGALAAVGGGVGLAANTAATFLNSQATKQNTLAATGGLLDSIPTGTITTENAAALPSVSAATSEIAQPQGRATTTTGTKRRKVKKTISQAAVRVTNKNFIYNRIYNKA